MSRPRSKDRQISSAGYVMLRAVGHPRASLSDMVFEHILVMEAHLGRYLTVGEVIHHKDKNRQNNSIENLELMDTKTHGRHHCAHLKNFMLGKHHSRSTVEKISHSNKVTKLKQWEHRRMECGGMLGRAYGMLTVVGFSHRDKSGNHYYDVLCTCGTQKKVQRTSLLRGKTKSCGCKRRGRFGERKSA